MGARVLVIDDSATIRKLVSAILARHGYVPIVANDGRAGLEKLRSSEIDIVLVDFSMPRMDGEKFCAAMRQDPRFLAIPIVLMSANQSACERLSRRGDVATTLLKPFEPRELIEAVESALAEEISADLDEDGTPSSQGRKRGQAEQPTHRESVARLLARTLAAPLAELSDRLRADVQVVEAVIARALGKPELTALAGALGLDSPDEPRPALAGEIATIALGEVLQVLQFQRQTGHLTLTNGDVEVVVYLREGFIDLVQGRGMSEKLRLGRYLVEEGLVTRDELEALLRGRSKSQLLGEMLVDLGVVTEGDVQQALARQSSELIYELLRWSSGRFAFSHRPFPNEARAARLGLAIASVVMEGFRRIDEWQLMEESFDFDEVLLRDEGALVALEPGKISRRERLVLDAIDGQKTAREIVDGLEVSPFDAYKVLYDFLRSRLVRRRAA